MLADKSYNEKILNNIDRVIIIVLLIECSFKYKKGSVFKFY